METFFKIPATPKIIPIGRALVEEKESVTAGLGLGLGEGKEPGKGAAVDCLLKRLGKVFSFGL